MLFLHISDIHFKRTVVGEPDDPHRALRNDMVRDVKAMRVRIGKAANGILISGDIAYHGVQEEFDYAYTWLETELCPAAGCQIEDVFVVPGNHDVDRSKESGPSQKAARQSLRTVDVGQVDGLLGEYMRDKTSAEVIFGPLEDYNRFAAKFLCALRPYVDNEKSKVSEATQASEDATDSKNASAPERRPALPYAVRDVALSDRSTLRMWGFSTVLVCDWKDAKDNMLVDPAAAQIEVKDGVTNLVMCHHPFNWLRNGGPFADRINAVAKVQLFGHEHTQRMDENKHYLRVRAGALQPERDEKEWKPGYNWLDIDVTTSGKKRDLLVKAWVRMHHNNAFLAINDATDKEIWENSYELPEWSPPDESKIEPVQTADTTSASVMTEDVQKVSVRSVTTKFFKLQEHEQRRVIAAMRLDRPGDRELKDYEQVIIAIRRSKAEGTLRRLDKILDDNLKGATGT